MYNNHFLSTWEEFTRSLELRFGSSAYENHQQTLFKLRQTITAAAYQLNFERLCNRVVGLTHTAILDCFLSGLCPDIQNELAVMQPTSISQAIGLAKVVESKLLATKPLLASAPRSFQAKPNLPILPTPPTRLALPTPPQPKPRYPICLLSPTEMQAGRAKG